MAFDKKTIRDTELKNKRVLLRVDYNVPLKNGRVADDYRIVRTLPTIRYILEHGAASLIIISHLGRPTGPDDKDCSLEPVAEHLSRLLHREVHFAGDCIGEEAKKVAAAGGVVMMENLRFHSGEEKNDQDFANALVESSGASLFVQDGFGVVHRKHASTEAVTHLLPSVAGLLVEQEYRTIGALLKDPSRPLTAVVGGAKISDKIDVLEKFIELADCVAVGGALANNFLQAERINVGKSLVEPEAAHLTRQVLEKARKAELSRNFQFLIPVDVVVSGSPDGLHKVRVVDLGSHSLADIESYPAQPKPSAYSVGDEEMILDIGPVSAGRIAGAIGMSDSVIWAGPLGVTETAGAGKAPGPFSHGTRTVVEAIIGPSNRHANKAFSLVGGGDTVAYVESQKLTEDFSFVSTGGSASLELLAGHSLPGVDALAAK